MELGLYFIPTHNETLSVVAVCIDNDGSTSKAQRLANAEVKRQIANVEQALFGSTVAGNGR